MAGWFEQPLGFHILSGAIAVCQFQGPLKRWKVNFWRWYVGSLEGIWVGGNSNIFMFNRPACGNDPNLTSIFFKWVETTNQGVFGSVLLSLKRRKKNLTGTVTSKMPVYLNILSLSNMIIPTLTWRFFMVQNGMASALVDLFLKLGSCTFRFISPVRLILKC